MKHRVILGGLIIAGVMAGCGGGGGDAGCSVYSAGCTNTTTDTTGTVSSSVSGTVVLSLSNNTISASSPGTVTALVKKSDGTPLANQLVTFAVANGTATVSPERVLTDSSGNASTTLVPVSGKLGADYVTASADLSSSTLSTRTAFSVSSVAVTLASVAPSPASIDAYGASVISVDVSGASSSVPVTVNFSSTCAAAAKAILSPSSVLVTGTTAAITYQDKGCGTTDRITAVMAGTSQQKQADLIVKAPVAQSLEFVSASPDKICLAGSGCSSSAVVSFRLKDQFGNPVAGREITFVLDIPNVADLSLTSAKTNSSGIAEVAVAAKAVPSPVRVHAAVALDGGGALSTVSNVLAINAGLPTQNAVSFSATTYNIDGLHQDGVESIIRVQLNDRFGNPVPDGTSVSFVSEGASVIPARCTTASGVCPTKFISSNYRPANGRVTVVAFAQGEESFVDTDGNNLHSAGESFGDLGKVFIDKNENGVIDAAIGEYLIGNAEDGLWSGNTFVRASRVFILSDSAKPPRLFEALGRTCTDIPLTSSSIVLHPTAGTATCRVQASFCLRDSNTAADAPAADGTPGGGNPVPAGAVLSVTTAAKGATVTVDNSPISGTVDRPTAHLLTAVLSDCTKDLEAAGIVDVTVKMPAGQTYTFQVGQIN